MTTASKLTLLRVVMIPAFMALLLLGFSWFALAVFILASLTDFVDGYVARHYNQVSDFGKFLDPLADKLLVFAAMLIFVQWNRMPAWAVMVAASKGEVLAAAWSGKIKTAATMAGLCAMIAFPSSLLDQVVTWVIILTTLYSGCEYFAMNWGCLGLGGK